MSDHRTMEAPPAWCPKGWSAEEYENNGARWYLLRRVFYVGKLRYAVYAVSSSNDAHTKVRGYSENETCDGASVWVHNTDGFITADHILAAARRCAAFLDVQIPAPEVL